MGKAIVQEYQVQVINCGKSVKLHKQDAKFLYSASEKYFKKVLTSIFRYDILKSWKTT